MYKNGSSMSRRIDHKIWKDPPHLLGYQPGTRLVRLSQDPRRKRSLLKLKPEDILPKPAPTNEVGRMQIWSQYLNFLRFEKLLIYSRY